MKLRSLVPNFYIHVSWSDLYNLTMGLIGNLYFPVCKRELLAQLQEWKEGQGTGAKHWMAAVPCPPLRSCG
jgi:hypothetical protein